MKRFIVPLQAFAALFLCSGMIWMVFVLASVNPEPPTAMDLQARNTQDLSFVNMNSTAVALAMQMLANVAPSPTGSFLLPVTGRETATASLEAVVTLKPVFTDAGTPTSTLFFIDPTATRKKFDTLVPTVVAATPAPTRTLRPPPATATITPAKPPTQTSLPTTVHPTDIPPNPTTKPTNTPIPQPTETEPPPTGQPTDPPTVQPTDPVVVTEPPPQPTSSN